MVNKEKLELGTGWYRSEVTKKNLDIYQTNKIYHLQINKIYYIYIYIYMEGVNTILFGCM